MPEKWDHNAFDTPGEERFDLRLLRLAAPRRRRGEGAEEWKGDALALLETPSTLFSSSFEHQYDRCLVFVGEEGAPGGRGPLATSGDGLPRRHERRPSIFP